MAFSFSLNKGKSAQLGSKAKADEEAKAREEKNALDEIMADVMEEHGEEKTKKKNTILGGLSEGSHETDPGVFVPTGSKRHFTGRQRSMKSGPGTLDSDHDVLFTRPPPLGYNEVRKSRFGGPTSTPEEEQRNESVYTTVIAKASNLPPAITPKRVEELFADFSSLKVVKVEKIPPSRPSSPSNMKRPSLSMKVIFDTDANARDLDDAMNKLNDKKYLGKGYYLHLDRYLGGRSMTTKREEEPFGATLQEVEIKKGFAPPPDLGGNNRDRERARDYTMNKRMMVTANPPPDLPTLRLIHQTVEAVILNGVEFEATLMNEPLVQDDERFAWLYNQRHPNNRYYRWCLHSILTSSVRPEVFERCPDWRGPKDPLPDQFASTLGDLVHVDAVSDDDNDDDDDTNINLARTILPIGDDYPGRAQTGYGIMPPRSRALLIWMLATLPPATALSDEVAAISNFAVDHAARGLDEVVALLVTNILTPLFASPANPKYTPPSPDAPDADKEAETSRRRAQLPVLTTNALRILSDVAFTTFREAGACYKYRNSIGSALVSRGVFTYLETLPAAVGMGRLAENQFRDDVNGVLRVWTDEQLFDKSVLQGLEMEFNEKKRVRDAEEERKAIERRRARKAAAAAEAKKSEAAAAAAEDVEMKDTDLDADADVPPPAGGELLQPETLTQTSTPAAAQTPADEENAPALLLEDSKKDEPPLIPGETAAARAKRLRPRAEDMFASDDEE